MRKSIFYLSILLLAAQPAFGRSLSPEEALNRALNQSRRVAPRAKINRSNVVAEPSLTVGNELYVFNRADEGFLIVSADEVAAPILGFSDSGSLDPANLPPSLRYWLEECSAQISQASAAGVEVYSQAREADFEPIAPLMSTLWDQTKPYNNDCPTYNGFRCPTGCVATAMAQVMKYHQWPAQVAADANISYTWRTGKQTLSADFSNYEFDWANMLDSYKGSYTDEQAEAVAKLMQACGYSVEMNYNTNASAAVYTLVGRGLSEYFKYDKGLHNEPRELYSDDEWNQLIYDNLHDCGPIVYWGGVHCFVCDGYQGNGYFHFNWGWSGDGDGWFLLNALNPSTVGTGGSAAGYNDAQGALLGIKPATSDNTERQLTFYTTGLTEVSTTGTWLKTSGTFINYSPYTVDAYNAYSIFNEEGTEHIATVAISTTTSSYSPDLNHYLLNGSVPTAEIQEGTYRVYPAVIVDGKDYIFKCPASAPGYVIYTRTKEGTQWVNTATLPDVGKKIIIDLSTNGDFYVGQPRVKISGIAQFTGDATATMKLTWRLLNPENNAVVCVGDEFTLQFTPEGNPFDIVSQWLDCWSVTPGDYTLALSYTDTAVSTTDYFNLATCPVTVSPKEDNVYKATGFTVDNATAVDPENISLSVTIEGESGYSYEDLFFEIYDAHDQRVWGPVSSPLYITAGNTTTVNATASITDAEPGETYYAKVYKKVMGSPSDIYAAVPFTVAKKDDPTVGIREISGLTLSGDVVTASAPILSVSVFTLSGLKSAASAAIDGNSARLDLSTLAPGLYLVRLTTAAGPVTLKLTKTL